MAPALLAITANTPTSIGLEVWMERVLERLDRLKPSWNADDVHGLRVALRRCRTMAETLDEVVPNPAWRKLKKASRKLFHALGRLRDIQVERALLKKIGSHSDPFRKYVFRHLSRQEKERRATAEKALDSFDRKSWQKWSRKLYEKAHFFPVESVVFQRIALARLNDAAALYQKAMEKKNDAAWHRTRIGIKRFRYVVENFLPQRYEVWARDLKQMQTLLGDLHDIDILRGNVLAISKKFRPTAVSAWRKELDEQRNKCLRSLIEKTSAQHSPWITWRAGFQWGHPVVAAAPPRTKNRLVAQRTQNFRRHVPE